MKISTRMPRRLLAALAIAAIAPFTPESTAADAGAGKKIVLIAGPESHPFGEHEFGAGATC